MPTKRIFDLGIILLLFGSAALSLPRLAARRWIKESNGVMNVIGGAVGVGQ
jgi:hypothetical protein